MARDFWKGGNKLFLGNVPPPQSRDNLGGKNVIVLLFISLQQIFRDNVLYTAMTPRALKVLQVLTESVSGIQGGRSWQHIGEGKNDHKNFLQANVYYFRGKCVVLRVIAILHI